MRDPIILERISFYLEIIICFLERLFRRALALVFSFYEIQQNQYSTLNRQFPGQLHNKGCLGRPKIVISQEKLKEFLRILIVLQL